jgi:hypothetical protein
MLRKIFVLGKDTAVSNSGHIIRSNTVIYTVHIAGLLLG